MARTRFYPPTGIASTGDNHLIFPAKFTAPAGTDLKVGEISLSLSCATNGQLLARFRDTSGALVCFIIDATSKAVVS